MPSRRPRAALLRAVMATAVAVSLAACSSSGPDDDPSGTSGTPTASRTPTTSSSSSTSPARATPLLSALAQVPASAAGQQVSFGQPVTALAADGGNFTGPYSRAVGYGAGFLEPASRLDSDLLGFDPLQAGYAITAGTAPRDATLLAGIRTTPQVATKVKAFSPTVSTAGSQTVYRFRADNAVNASDALGRAFVGTMSPNLLSVAGQNLRYARSSAGLANVSATSDTLADDDSYTAVASCLGRPLAALLDAHQGVEVVATGLSGSKGAEPTEQLCAAASSASAASSLATKIRSALSGGTSKVSKQKWSALLTDVSVSTSGSTVKVTAHPTRDTGGLLLEAALRDDLPGL